MTRPFYDYVLPGTFPDMLGLDNFLVKFGRVKPFIFFYSG